MAYDPCHRDDGAYLTEEGSTSDSALLSERPSCVPLSYRRLGLAVVGIAALVSCGVFAVQGQSGASGVSGISGRMLFEDSQLHEVATDNIMNVGLRHGHLAPADRKLVRATVEESFQNISRAPGNAESLGLVRLNEEQKGAVLHMMRYLSDPRVQRIGLEVSHAVRDSGSEHPEALKRAIAERLRPHLGEMSRLHQEAIPAVLRQFTDNGHGWEAILEPRRVQLSKTFGDEWDSKISSSSPAQAPRSLEELEESHGFSEASRAKARKGKQVTGIIAAILEETRFLLDILRSMSKMWKDKDLNVPPLITSAIGFADTFFGFVSCELDAITDSSSVEGVSCPLQEGTQGMDAMREFFALIGLLGDNKASNGRQGNHGNPVVGDGEIESETKGLLEKSPELDAWEASVSGLSGTKMLQVP
eukprot:CAMPEP_0170601748 /NCGR_PEP_ID=MMETSP0224-20130122/18024_1 /TAXON_ID=285029 /ORGANISM="Togula jolla, Strain CCCM 725" /LENGTH=416 /DNA_ID=CAMNT_0010926543 /DNA_START=51 /DNA_END=1302 /DNA_ORIENTATION=-